MDWVVRGEFETIMFDHANRFSRFVHNDVVANQDTVSYRCDRVYSIAERLQYWASHKGVVQTLFSKAWCHPVFP